MLRLVVIVLILAIVCAVAWKTLAPFPPLFSDREPAAKAATTAELEE
jgi:hypothetical protein